MSIVESWGQACNRVDTKPTPRGCRYDSAEDFEEVAKILGFKLLNIEPDFDKFYKNLSDDDRKTVDFMMKL